MTSVCVVCVCAPWNFGLEDFLRSWSGRARVIHTGQLVSRGTWSRITFLRKRQQRDGGGKFRWKRIDRRHPGAGPKNEVAVKNCSRWRRKAKRFSVPSRGHPSRECGHTGCCSGKKIDSVCRVASVKSPTSAVGCVPSSENPIKQGKKNKRVCVSFAW